MRLWLHASSVWPANIDFDLFSAYTAGCTVEEIVEQILAVNAIQSDDEDKKRSSGRPFSLSPSATPAERLEPRQVLGDGPLFYPILSCFDYCTPGEVGMALNAARKKSADEDGEDNKIIEACTDDFGKRWFEALRKRNCFYGLTSTFHRDLHAYPPSALINNRRFLTEEVEEQFNFFDMLCENHLSTPYVFLSSYAIPIGIKQRRRVVEIFYSVDEQVLKAFFGERMHKLVPEDKMKGFFFGKSRGRRNQKLQKLIQSDIKEGSLRRQWENLRWVSTFLVSAYRGRDGVLIPCTTPLLTALEQCFSLRGELGMQYWTFVFGFEHRLTGRVWERLSYTDRGTICFALASMWCDDSQLMLREKFCTVCSRIASLLDENRVVAEMHQLLFGEAMRPRWQVQLNEVQRAISSNTGVGSGGSQHVFTIKLPLSPSGKAIPRSFLRRNTSLRTLELSANMGTATATTTTTAQSALTKAQCFLGGSSQQTMELQQASSSGSFSPRQTGHSSNSVVNCTTNNNNMPAQAVSGMCDLQSPVSQNNFFFSANGAFTRDFLLEFPFIIRCMVRVATAVGDSVRFHEALETFYTRVYLYLENMGSRISHVPNTNTNKMSRENYFGFPESLPEVESVGDNLGGNSRGSGKRSVITDMVINDGDAPDHVGQLLKNNSFDCVEKFFASTSVTSGAAVNILPVTHGVEASSQHFLMPASPNQTQSITQNFAGCLAGGVNNLMYLSELCVFLNLLPSIFTKLTTLTAEDHSMCDEDFSNFVLALKFLTQIHMASEAQ